MKVKKIATLLFIGSLLLITLITSIKYTFDGYYKFYYSEKKYEENSIFKLTKKITSFYPISFFESYTGFDSGYGFFAPNVSSSFVFIFKIYDLDGNLIGKTNNVNLKAKESDLRFITLNSMFIEKLKMNNTKANNYSKYLDVIVNQISKYVKKDYPSNCKIETSLYLFDYPRIENFNKGEKQKLILIKKYNYNAD